MQAIFPEEMKHELVRIILLGLVSFVFAMLITPIYTHLAYKYKFWKQQRTDSITGEVAKVFKRLHAQKHKRNIPTMAGVIVLVTIVVVSVLFNWSRSQTWLPVIATLGAGAVGLLDDVINLKSSGKGVAGLRSSLKFWLITLVALLGSLYFYFKLEYTSIGVPFLGQFELGWLIIPLFVLVVISSANAVNITDGLDGLAGGLLISAFVALGLIALLQGNFGIAAFCATVAGALVAYVWFNIYPARFFMGDVGSFALGTALGVVAMLTDTLLLLPVIGIVFVAEAASSLIQIFSKRVFKRKVFISAPIHHHFEAIGWPETKVTMRFWLIGQVAAVIGVALAVAGGLV